MGLSTKRKTRVGRFLAQVMEDRQINQKELAEKTGLNDGTLRKLLYGGNPTLDTILTVSYALEIDPSELIRRGELDNDVVQQDQGEDSTDSLELIALLRDIVATSREMGEPDNVLVLRIALALTSGYGGSYSSTKKPASEPPQAI